MISPRAFIDGKPADAVGLLGFVRNNYGHFTTMQLRRGGVRGLGLHLARLESATQTLFGVPMDMAALRSQLRSACEGVTDASLRVSVISANYTPRSMPSPAQLSILIIVDSPAPPPMNAVRLKSLTHSHHLPEIKHLGQFDLLYARKKAIALGFDDALLLTLDGHVTEGPTFNTGFLANDCVYWPMGAQLIGTTRQLLTDALQRCGKKVLTQNITLEDAQAMGEAFCCHAGGLWPIASIDAKVFSPTHHGVMALSEMFEGISPEPI